ncbi:carbohydrate ABC transporter permease [Clostridium perfringens]|nr:carbohydrate ABC transporter permease [Clostridium perfringens]
MGKKKISIGKIGIYTILIIYSLFTLVPFIWTIVTSIKTQAEIAAGNTILPNEVTLDAYKTILSSKLPLWVMNSTLVAFMVTLLNLVFNTMAGYSLARIDFKGRDSIFSFLLALIMVPSQVTMIPTYIIVSKLGLINTHMALVLTSAVNIAYIFMMRQFFINFPRDVEEAGLIDGLSRTKVFFKIVLPIAKPALATQSIFIFMGTWNEFMKPLLYISSENKYMLTQGLNALAKSFKNVTAWNVIMAGALISIIPIFIAYIFLNKHFITINDQSSGVK